MAYTAPLLHPRELISKYPSISKKTFAALLGVEIGTIYQWNSRDKAISTQTLRQVADINERLETDPAYRDRVFKEIQPKVLGYQ
jgi:hypothetical protein